MIQTNDFKNKFLFGAISLWVVYSILYVVLKEHYSTNLLAGYLSLVGEAGLDLVAALLAYRLFKISKTRDLKIIFGLFGASFIAALTADATYNIILNLTHVSEFSTLISFSFEIPFALFLLLQLIAFANIIISSNDLSQKSGKKTYIPYIIVSFLMFSIFMFGITWEIKRLSYVGFFQCLDTILEVLGFSLAMICLSRSKTQVVRYISTGYLFIVSSDFIIRYHVVSGLMPYLNTLESCWILGLMLICLGLIFVGLDKKKHSFKLSSVNSLQSHIAIFILMFWLISAIFFLVIYYIYLPISGDYLQSLNKNLLSIIIPFSVVAIFCSNYISTKISLPLAKLENIISMAMEVNKADDYKNSNTNTSEILEFISLENFVSHATTMYKKKHDIEMEFSKSARQVAHDIKSPLCALENVIKNLTGISTNQINIMSSSISTITDISENLLEKHRNLSGYEPHTSEKIISPENIFSLISDVISEKKIQFKNKKIKIKFTSRKSGNSLFSLVNITDFKRVMSNLINNAYESINELGSIAIILRQDFNNTIIDIIDTGCGIPKEIVKKLEKNAAVSHNKKYGNGLGLLNAVHCIKEWGGNYDIKSNDGAGTCVSIILPIQEPANWIQREIYLIDNQTIIIVDDDLAIYNLWKEKLSKYVSNLKNIKIVYLKNPEELEQYVKDNNLIENIGIKYLFLIDYYFSNSNLTGLDAIKKLRLFKNTILVTSQYPNTKIQNTLAKIDVKLLLKPSIQCCSLKLVPKNPDFVLLDDNSLVTTTWEIEATRYNKKIVTFNSTEIFRKYINIFNKDTTFYLDSNLGEYKGEDIAEALYKKGFFNLYITTGYDQNEFCNLPYIKGVVGKEPFFLKSKAMDGFI